MFVLSDKLSRQDVYVPRVAGADVHVLQMSILTLDPQRRFDLDRQLRRWRNEGMLIVGSGFLTHGLPAEARGCGDVDALMGFRAKAAGMAYAHPTLRA